jgi:hypothetical protein
MGKIEKNDVQNNAKIGLSFSDIGDADWDMTLKKIRDQEHPMRELELCDACLNYEPVAPSFIKLTEAIAAHTTLIKLSLEFYSVLSDDRSTILLKAIKDNHSIKHLSLRSEDFDSIIAGALGQIFLNNEILRSLTISVSASYNTEYG